MEPQNRTLDLQTEREDLKVQMDRIEDRITERVDEAIELEGSEADEDLQRMDVLNEEVTELEAQLSAVRGYARVLDRALDDWEGSEVVIKELTGQEVRIVSAEAQRRADSLGIGEDRASDIRDIEFLKRAVVSTPAGAPEPSEIHGLPNLLFEWLAGRANALNSVGDFDMGNSSLRERMMERRGEN